MHCDSLGNGVQYREATKKMRKYLTLRFKFENEKHKDKEFEKKFGKDYLVNSKKLPFCRANLPKQDNDFDCGVFLIEYINQLMKEKPKKYPYRNLKLFKKDIIPKIRENMKNELTQLKEEQKEMFKKKREREKLKKKRREEKNKKKLESLNGKNNVSKDINPEIPPDVEMKEKIEIPSNSNNSNHQDDVEMKEKTENTQTVINEAEIPQLIETHNFQEENKTNHQDEDDVEMKEKTENPKAKEVIKESEIPQLIEEQNNKPDNDVIMKDNDTQKINEDEIMKEKDKKENQIEVYSSESDSDDDCIIIGSNEPNPETEFIPHHMKGKRKSYREILGLDEYEDDDEDSKSKKKKKPKKISKQKKKEEDEFVPNPFEDNDEDEDDNFVSENKQQLEWEIENLLK